jgi:phage FluMu gp28-like protein
MSQAVTSEWVRSLLKGPLTETVDRSDVSLSKYRRALPDREWRALEAWASTLYPYQRAWVFEPARNAILLGSRQNGKSHGTAGFGVLTAAFRGELATIISIGQTESSEVLDKAHKHAEVLVKLGSRMARVTSSPTSKVEIRFASGGRILALPSTAGRSFTGNLFLDELAYQENADAVWDSATWTTIRGSLQMRVASTPNGVGNLFHSLWSDPKKRINWATHEVTLKQALDAGMKVDLVDCWSKCQDDARIFDQVFNCRFLDGEQQYIPTDYVTRAANGELYCLGGENFAGLDIGREHDLTALVVVNWDGVIARVVAIRTAKRTDHDALLALAGHAVKNHRVRRLCVDQTGIGAFPVEEMQRAWGRQRVEGVTFGLGSKEEMATTLHGAFAGEWLRIPRDDSELTDVDEGNARGLIEDVCSLRRIVTAAGNIRYDAARGADGHADRAWALALALHAITNRPATRHVRFGGAEQDAEQPWQT